MSDVIVGLCPTCGQPPAAHSCTRGPTAVYRIGPDIFSDADGHYVRLIPACPALPCPKCHGAGTVPPPSSMDEWFDRVTCPACDGKATKP